MYYHQVQLQLYVSQDRSGWWEFCIFTTKGMTVERIFPDQEWRNENITKLESYYNKYIMLEILSQKLKPSHIILIIITLDV